MRAALGRVAGDAAFGTNSYIVPYPALPPPSVVP
jgi:hypothetical protein